MVGDVSDVIPFRRAEPTIENHFSSMVDDGAMWRTLEVQQFIRGCLSALRDRCQIISSTQSGVQPYEAQVHFRFRGKQYRLDVQEVP